MKEFIPLCLLLFLFIEPATSQVTYKVGPGQKYDAIGLVPWESLAAGDSVLIYQRDLPYKEKWVINRIGQADKWIIIKGIPNATGLLPVIDGQDATTRSQLNYWNEERGVIKIGGSNSPADGMPAYIKIENLDIRNGRDAFSFTGRNGITSYDGNASAIYIEKGENIEIRNCTFSNCGNGFFAAHQSKNILVESCWFHDNGNVGSIYEHNNYTEAMGITFQFNHFSHLLEGSNGNNLKDRSAGTIIRYNWIEGGNRQLDLVDSDYEEFINTEVYRSTYVYGNILIEPDDEGNSQICHYGGDSGDEDRYRKGKLYFYNNTVISTRSGNTTLFRLSTNDEIAECFNNIIYITESGDKLAMLNSEGILNLKNNWIKPGWVTSHGELTGKINDLGNLTTGTSPGFINESLQDFHLAEGSVCIGQGFSVQGNYPVQYEYEKHQGKSERQVIGAIDIGAYEYEPPTGNASPASDAIKIVPNPVKELMIITSRSEIQKLTIENLSGQKIIMTNPNKKIFSVNTDNLTKGIYVLMLETEQGKCFKKFIKE